ncbi:PAS domain S-box-containing protein/diguanylate cyclase (GGDEF) domain-containing protein [Neptunomonas antarctica]|uniref:PAS domain S-box-containing protein/diguanylate cyclase (GGDEF) domain-containing protein n=2 Tax=Neptunomonas antarctica TaxID=619304 RepID=A0A1N7KLW5_9GAMM|nr:PAS domain S-box-containing protein/diguanylate cyclase (GGDEF) domain-containing protein [Neptunomonas antarctica]
MILLVMLFALLVLRENTKLAELNDKMYQHPFSVSVAVLEANNDILAMHRYMKDVVLATNKDELEVAISLVEQHEHEVYRQFELIKERYLGNEGKINVAYITFVDWKSLRDEVIALKRDNEDQLAAVITKGKGAAYVKVLNQRMSVLQDFARNKALEFKDNSQHSYDASKSYLYAMLIFMLLSSAITVIFVILLVRRADDYRNEAEERFDDLINSSKISMKKKEEKIKRAHEEITLQNKDKEKRADELVIAKEEKGKRADELVIAKEEKGKRADELVIAKEEKGKRADELVIAKEEKGKRADELVIAKEEKGKRADELVIAKEEKGKRADELVIAKEEKGKRADELVIAKEEKGKRADELVIAKEEKGKRADELVIAKEEKGKRADELILANEEKGKRADELILANEELAIQNKEKDKRADELALANIELAFQNKEKDKRADELIIAKEEKEQRADELILANEELAFQNKEKDKLANELALAASVFTHAREGITITDAAATIIDVNDTFTHITGFSREEAIGQNPRILQSGRQSPDFYVGMWQALLKDDYWSGEVWNRRKNGEVYAEMKTISAVRNKRGITTHYVALGSDITPMKEHQDQLEWMANYDVLTSLPNRTLLADRLSQAMVQSLRHHNSVAVVFLDLDGFKDVNDVHGHDVGDDLLIVVSLRMKEALREGDTLARIGGDEFVAVLADLASVEDCEPVLGRLLLAASEPITVGDVVLKVSASIGVTLYPQDSVDADLLMRHADQAMYEAKESGKNRYHLFDTVQDDAVKEQRENLEAIRSALDNHQFILYYQPKVNMRTGAVTGVEALIRWQHPKRGLLNPIEFLPVIENNPMIREMGEWVIDTALTQISQWQETGLNLSICTSVNIAAVQLQQPDFTERLATLLAAHPDVDPRYLELEVLETSALDDVGHVSAVMNACMARGVNFALDDFGTGYSSLTHLRRLPAGLIKIDQSFVRDMLVDADDLAIVEGVIALAKSFKREVIAEGVETIEHGIALLQLGCELAQGYGIARPMPASDVPAWIREWKPDISWPT